MTSIRAPLLLLSERLTMILPSMERFPVAVRLFTLKLPVLSRFTIALAALADVGATVQFRPNVPAVMMGEPVTVKSELGALSPTLVTVPEPVRSAQPHADPLHFST